MNNDLKLTDLISKADFKAAFDQLAGSVRSLREMSAVELTRMKQMMDSLSSVISSQLETSTALMRKEMRGVLSQVSSVTERMGSVEARVATLKDGKDGANGKDGLNGKDGASVNQQDVIDALTARIPPQMDGIAIRDELEALVGDNRLDASAIKNLPVPSKEQRQLVRPLSYLPDVDVGGIAVGQALKWDGIRWIPFTPAGGAGTPVYNEVVSGSATTFTLAHTPTSGTERIYALGQRLVPTTDYTIASATITTVSTWDAGALTADYEY